MKNKLPSERSIKTNFKNNQKSDVLSVYYRDPLNVIDLFSLDIFRTDVALPNTVFEEVDLFDPFDKPYIQENENSKSEQQPALRKAVHRLFEQALQTDDQCCSLIAHHLLLYKRIQVLDKVQEQQHTRNSDVKKLKLRFESLPLYSPVTQKEENIALLKNLQKAMLKSDVKKGLFSKLRKSRSETVYRLLSKYTSPLSMPGVEVQNVRDYLVQFSIDSTVNRKSRSKALGSLLLLAMSQGSLHDILLVLQSLLSFSPPEDPLCNDCSEEGGIFIRNDIIKSLNRFHFVIKELIPKHSNIMIKDNRFNPDIILKHSDHSVPSNAKKPISVRRLFVFLLAHIDILSCSYLSGSGLLQNWRNANTLSIHFCIETLPKTFEIIMSLLNKLMSVKSGTSKTGDEFGENTRLYCIVACLRLLRLNVETLYLWRKENEQLNSLALRTSLGKADWKTPEDNYLYKLKKYLLNILEEKLEQQPVVQNNEKLQEDNKQKVQNIHELHSQSSFIKSNIKEVVTGGVKKEVESVGDDPILRKQPKKGKQITQQSGFEEEIKMETTPRSMDRTEEIHSEYDESDDFIVIGSPSMSRLSSKYPIPTSELHVICTEISSIICSGFVLFYPTYKEQVEFILDSLKNMHLPLKRTILLKILQRMVNDITFFDAFMIQGVGVRESSLGFIEKIITFLKNNSSFQITAVITQKEKPLATEEISMLFLKILLMWQNHLLKTISSSDVRYRTSTLPKCSLKNGEGKTLLEYSARVFQACNELLNEVCMQCTGINLQNIQQELEESLHKSIIGYLLFPLLQSFSKLLWRCGGNDIQKMDRICSFLSTFVADLLKVFNILTDLLQYKDKPFEWQVVETDHPYCNNLNEKQDITFNDEDEKVLLVAVKFDPRSRTASHQDNLRISSNYCSSLNQSLQFSGYGNTIPVNPLITWGNSISMSFSSDDKQTDWGFKCYIFPIYNNGWLYDLAKCLGWLGGRCATFILSSFPYSTEEGQYNTWLNSRLFCNGLESSENEFLKPGDKVAALKKAQTQFLEEFIENKGSARILADFIYNHLKNESMMMYNNKDILHAERAIIAAILKHSELIGTAIRFARLIEQYTKNPKNFGDIQKSIPQQLITVWRRARQIRTWMIQKKQQQNMEYKTLKDIILKKAKFLLLLRSATSSDIPSVDQNSVKRIINIRRSSIVKKLFSEMNVKQSTKSATLKEQVIIPDAKSNAADKIFTIVNVWKIARKWKSLINEEHKQEEKENLSIISDLIMKFVKSKLVPSRLQALMNMRKERAVSRARAFTLYTELLDCTSFSTVKAIIIQGVKEILKSRSMKEDNSLDFHYFNNLEGCGPIYQQIINDSFRKFLSSLITEIETSKKDVMLTGLLRQILETCFISFKPIDVEWVLELDFLKKLCPVMYSTTIKKEAEDEQLKFKRNSSIIEEKKEINKWAWKIFRLLSVRCVEMLEEWDKEKYKLVSVKRAKIMQQLNELRDKIFSLLFTELETMIRENSIIPDILEEMLSLMVSLCSNQSAQSCLSENRFQKLLLPLLKLGIPRVQELSLKLCSHLILGQKDAQNTTTEQIDDSKNLLNVLFEFLGAFEMMKVVGKDVINPSSNPIPLTMAREIFVLIRKLFKTSSPDKWRNTIKSMMTQSLKETTNKLLQIQTALATINMDGNNIFKQQLAECFKHVFAALTLIIGFSYIPSVGEDIIAKMAGRWVQANVHSIEEHRHSVKVTVPQKDGTTGSPQRVSLSDIKVRTQEPIDEDLFDVGYDLMNSLLDFIEITGDIIIHKEKRYKLDTTVKLLFSSLWMNALKVINEWIKNPKLLQILVDSGRLVSLMHFMEENSGVRYGKKLKLNACTYSCTGKQFTRQYYYSCLTCGMANTRAVCAVCARICHRGHRLGAPEIGEFYCDCGAGEGKFSCKALRHAPSDEILTLERMESLLPRLQNLMPLYAELSFRNDQNSAFLKPVKDIEKGPIHFTMNGHDNTGYSIDIHNNEIMCTQSSDSSLLSMIGTDKPIPESWSRFYFEIEILELGEIFVGLSETVNSNQQFPDILHGSYVYHINDSCLYKNGKLHQPFGVPVKRGDIIGCGWSKEQKSIFFTLNGNNMGDAFSEITNQGKTYFPVIILSKKGTSVRSNLGARLFAFDISKSYGLTKDKTTSMLSKLRKYSRFTASTKLIAENQKLVIKELKGLGYSLEECEQAAKKYPEDLNAAASHLFRIKTRPIRQQLADQLQAMGFDRDLCLRALKVNGDDVNMALNWLLDGNYPTFDDKDDLNDAEDTDRGSSFLGAEICKNDVDLLVTRGMLQNQDVLINENMFSEVQIHKVTVDDLLVINPYLKDENKTPNSVLMKMKGLIGVVTRKLLNGTFIQTVDPTTGTSLSAFVSLQNLLSPPKELSGIPLSELGVKCLSKYKAIAGMYCRNIVQRCLTKCKKKIQLKKLGTDARGIYRALKYLFTLQYHEQDHSFITHDSKLPRKLEEMVHELKSLVVENDKKEETPFFDLLVDEALSEINQFTEGKPHFRKVAYKNEYNNQKNLIRFWGATSLCITFASKCELATPSDILTLYYDKYGRKQAKQLKGPLILPRRMVICGDRFWFEFKSATLREGSGFQFYVTPATYRLKESVTVQQPNLALATLILKNISSSFYTKNKQKTRDIFECGLKFLMTPFAPFKGTMCDAMCNLSIEVISKIPHSERPKLTLLKQFRLELEELYIEFQRHMETNPNSLPIFHRLIDFMSVIRTGLASDLCSNVFLQQTRKNHLYSVQESTYGKYIRACTACTMTVKSYSPPRYHSQDESRCQCTSSTQFKWSSEKKIESNLVPIEKLNINPSDWFEHLQWIDQLAIVRQLAECFLKETNLPEWVFFEAALETKKKVCYKESPHPYHVVKDSGQITIPGAKTLFISFDKHSKTHKCDRLLFSSKFKGGDDLGSYGGDELKDKTIIVHGSTVYYTFTSVGGDHECSCNNCGCRINGVRYHCTECDDYDVCERCVKKVRVHNDTHLFLKIRRPVDCVPAALPHLYTNRWINTPQFRGTTHVGVKCNACGMNPIRGIRYWCENCEDYNLCERCAEEEFKYHDRMHVFLRVVRPLPPKHQLPPNALPYGLVYEKDLDTHWGYLFSVSSSDSCARYDDPQIEKIMKDIKNSMKGWTKEMDAELVQYVEQFCNGWQSLEWNGLTPTSTQLNQFTTLSTPSLKSLRYRFIILKLLNRKVSRVLQLLNLEDNELNYNHLGSLISALRKRIFNSVKMDVWMHTVQKTVFEMNPITLKLNRQKAAEETLNKELKAENSLFNQAYQQVQAMSPRVLSRKNGAWKVVFLGESADDYGGPFRESLTQMCTELENAQLDLLINVPNAQNSVGQNRDKFIPNPQANSSKDLKWFKFIGVIMAVGLLSKNVLPLDFPSIVWKLIVKEQITIKDLEAIDQHIVQSMQSLRDIDKKGVDAQTFSDVILENFTTLNSAGVEVELIKNGKEKRVTFDTRHKYASLVENYRLNESKAQIEAIREGLYSIISPRFFPIFSWNEMEMLICGTPDIDLDTLKKHTIYEGYTAQSREIRDFWSILQSFDRAERSLYLRFVWGRSRLPVTEEGFTHPMKIQRLDKPNPDKYLPLSHTCFFSIELPPYSNKQIMHNKLLYAISHCKAIDTDFTTNANESLRALTL